MNLNNSTSKHKRFVAKLFPSLFVIKDGKLFFTDEKLFRNELYIMTQHYNTTFHIYEHTSSGSQKFIMLIDLDNHMEFESGHVKLPYDAVASLETLVTIFEYDLEVIDSYGRTVDPDVVRRQYTINNIIHYEHK